MFPGRQGGIWTWDAEAGQYYLHRFYEHQPDLNVASADVREEIRKIIGFWLAAGPRPGSGSTPCRSSSRWPGRPRPMELDPHEFLRDLRAFLSRRSGEAVLLGEVNLEAAEQHRVLRRRGRRRAAPDVRLPA